ncbi:helix-turn-helix domain-containing protein [Granulicella sp. WH15]|uniref:substrate-binding domain-containing protein n=1 Tax=Granulicella sp. WH15 TaxID=2602070 RepID=UPI0013677A3E|nr:substrate-binding domain-containing protein [Granulicella sp. WH15]QHN05088.1 helix-turn-helix domain-containing protein [Granulicella sp. WH15]
MEELEDPSDLLLDDEDDLETPTRRGDRNESVTVLRACEVLKAFRHRGEELHLAEIVSRTGLPKTTTFRLLRTLVHGGLLERAGAGVYRNRFETVATRQLRIGFAAQGDSEFCRSVMQNIETAAAREHVHLITVNNRYSAREALRNADLLIREGVDLILEFQTYERVAPVIASKFLEANTPVIAIEIPHPGATYFGANNYKAGLIGGKALSRWAREHWGGMFDQLVLLELPIAGSLLELRITGFADGLRTELPSSGNVPIAHLDGRGDFEQILGVMRQYLRRTPVRRTLIGAVNDVCALAALRAFDEAGISEYCAVVGQNAILDARNELRRPGTRLVGTVAYFPERYGDEIIPLAIAILQKKMAPSTIFVKHQLITQRNVDLIYPLDKGRSFAPALVRRC